MKILKLMSTLLVMLLASSTLTMANSEREIEEDSNDAVHEFINELPGAKKYLENAKGYLIFPDIAQAGFFIGGKYGEGVLRVGNKTKAYYSISSASVGFQMGIQKYASIIVFTSDAALNRFLLDEDEWDSDVDGKIVMADWNSEEDLDSIDYDGSMVAYVFDSTGMMGNFTLEGTKFERITPDDD